MKPISLTLRLSVFLLSALSAIARQEILLDDGWSFLQGDPAGAETPAFDTASWRRVDVPHDWSIEGPFDRQAPTTGAGAWLPSGVAWYRRTITLPPTAEGKRVWLEFDGVMGNSDVWLDGTLLGKRPGGYTSFRYDVTELAAKGLTHHLAVRADTSAQPASRWYSGAGIYRHVRMVIAHPVHIAPWGVHITTPEADPSSASVEISTQMDNASTRTGKITLRSRILGPDGRTVSSLDSSQTLEAGRPTIAAQRIRISNPALWSVQSPELHTLVTQILSGENVIDEVRTPFGIRTAVFKSETGFWLNGKNLKIQGVCLHHDGGAVGAAVPLNVWERRLKILRGLGVNGIRTAHNPPAPEFLDLCDRMGFLVMDEFFDCWMKAKNPHDYHLYFKEWSKRDLRDGILRDRNHPSIVLYSVGNEIHDTTKPDAAKEILKGLVEVCHATDPSRPVTQALFRPNSTGDYENGLADLLDVIGTNYRDKELLQAWKQKPGRLIIGTEQGHERSTWTECRDNPQHSGQFLWCGVDYLGESRSWPLTVFNGGLLDRAGFIQPRGFERMSWWSSTPMVSAHRRIAATEATPADPGYEALEWKRRQVLFADWSPTDTSPHEENVEVYSNAEEVELFLNDRSLGKKSVRKDGGANNWQVPFEPGTLRAVARTKGKEVATHTLRTAGKPAKIEIIPDRTTLGTGFDDVCNAEVRILDENGTLVPDAALPLQFAVSAPGKLVGVDSGNVVSIEPFQASSRLAYQGRALVIARASRKGSFTLTATAEGLPPATITLTAAD